MFNPVHHHCHPFTDFYKKLICAEFKLFFLVRKSDTLIRWRACLLVVRAGLDPRTYSIGTLQISLRSSLRIVGIKAGTDGAAGAVGAGGKRIEARVSANWTFISDFMAR